MSVDALLKEIESLSGAERAEMKVRLAEQFPDDTEEGISPELARLLDARAASATGHPELNVPWEAVYAESLKRTGK